jgi:hypothetical protein
MRASVLVGAGFDAGFWKSVECLKENCASGLRDGRPVIGIPIEGPRGAGL